MSKWIVSVLEKSHYGDVEISVLMTDYTDGRKHFGFFNKDKKLIANANRRDELIFNELMKTADAVAVKLNAIEKVNEPITFEFSNMGHLRKIMKELENEPDDKSIVTQVVGTEGGAWTMRSSLVKTPNIKWGIVLNISHPNLKQLPKIEF